MKFKIKKQTSAEHDDFLVECFEESYFIRDLLENEFSIVLGRKGNGKTALARYLQNEYRQYGLDYSHRITVTELHGLEKAQEKSDSVDHTLFFILTRTIQLLLSEGLLNSNGVAYWKDFLIQNDLQDIDDYQTFIEWSKTNKVGAELKIAKMGVDGFFEKHYERAKITDVTGRLFRNLQYTVSKKKKILIFVDDISDYLDRNKFKELETDIEIIRDILLSLDKQNSALKENKIALRFITCLRDDLLENMSGSNINKLANNSLLLNWSEESFCKLLIRRLPFFQDDLENCLSNPIKAIIKQFPNKIFTEKISSFGTKHYNTGFYAYMMAISFNRPRDFLKYCFCMRNRLSEKKQVTYTQIESAEIEYSDYLIMELRDELSMTSILRGFGSDLESIKELVQKLSSSDNFGYSQLRTEMAYFLKQKKSTHRLVSDFIRDLWWYGILGFKSSADDLIHFKYFNRSGNFLSENLLKTYTYYLHRGIGWAVKKKTEIKSTK